MKKGLKALSIASLVSVLAISGCSCKASKKKVDEVTVALAESSILSVNDKATDFVARYEKNDIDQMGLEVKTTAIVKRDAEHDMYILQYTEETFVGEAVIPTTEMKYKVYSDNGKVYIQDMTETDSTPLVVNYSSPYYVYENSKKVFGINFFELVNEMYDQYKTVPYNACASKGVPSDVSNIYEPMKAYLECEARKELFAKEYTYVVGYNTSITQWDEVTVKVNDEGMMERLFVNQVKTNDTNSFSLTINYSNIDLTK